MSDNTIGTGVSVLQSITPPNLKFIENAITAFTKEDSRRALMLTSQNYYQNKNDIFKRKRTYIDENGKEQETQIVANNTLSHPNLRKLANQKVNYLLSKAFTLSSEDEKYLIELNNWFSKDNMRLIKNTGKDAIINGVGWVQMYYSPEGILEGKRIPAEEVIPFWADIEHTKLKTLIRFYVVIEYDEEGEPTEVTKIEYYTPEGVWYFVETEDGIIADPDYGNEIQGNYSFIIKDEENTEAEGTLQEMVWGKIPFIAFKYNSDEVPLLQLIKPLIDNYDLITSDMANNIQDVPNSMLVIEGYDGTNREEARKNIATHRMIFIRSGGKVTPILTPLDAGVTDSHLNRLRKDIYDAANGVDMQDVNIGNNSEEALKYKFANLDMDSEDFSNELQAAFQEIAWYIKEDAILQGRGDFLESEFEVVFNKDIAVNESTAMDICVKAQSIQGISRRTIVENVPFVTDAEKEIAQYEKEQKELLENVDELGKLRREFVEEEEA